MPVPFGSMVNGEAVSLLSPSCSNGLGPLFWSWTGVPVGGSPGGCSSSLRREVERHDGVRGAAGLWGQLKGRPRWLVGVMTCTTGTGQCRGDGCHAATERECRNARTW